MKRVDAIRRILSDITDELVICSCGMISREVYLVNDRPKNFYVMGSMGASLGIGIGLALNKPEMDVVVIAGDGEILTSLGTLVLMNKLKLKNLKLYILDNNSYSSTGGQPTCSDAVDFTKITDCEVYKIEPGKGNAGRVKIPHKEITKRFYDAVNKK